MATGPRRRGINYRRLSVPSLLNIVRCVPFSCLSCRCHAAPRLADGAPRRFYNPNGDYDDADKEELVEECKASGEEVVRSASPASRSRRGA